MKTSPVSIDTAELLAAAEDPDKTPFDYIVVGSGAGGGPLAARLALEGRRVLVIEAGVDPATGAEMKDPSAAPRTPGPKGVREVYAVPALNAASTEDPQMSWDFSVRHFESDARQEQDEKYNCKKDASREKTGASKGGIFYPRASALGGCTAHHAMVMVRPNDADWDRMAAITGDSSWRAENMQGYFAKLENCLYYNVYRGLLGVLRWLLYLLDPRGLFEPGGHGSKGWQKTSFISPAVILGIVKGDWTFLRVLFGVLRAALADRAERSRLLRAILRLEIVQMLDPNVRSPDFPTRASRLSLIPVATDGACRHGVREHLLDVATRHPDRLVLRTGVHATRVIFKSADGGIPRAAGVEVAKGLHLYGASPLSEHSQQGRWSRPPPRTQYFARREIILCGGTFNTPQLLMLSGIGDAAYLKKLKIDGPRDRAGREVASVVNLPGIGTNLQDRYEVSVISEATREFSVLKGACFRSGNANDPALREWEQDKTGLYTTNGAAVAMLLSSEKRHRAGGDPDLFLFGVPAAFRGYYWNWSRELLRRTIGAPAEQRNLWTWLILKAYTHNNRGTVRLTSNDPFAPPQILFNSFPAGPGSDDDIEALCDGVRNARRLNEYINAFSNEVQPGTQRRDGSRELKDWVQTQAWGHHACGTCRIGPDRWQANVMKLSDVDAVLDSGFRVHGVHGLRVVDASVFPHIPGYFLVSSVLMIAEKAADTILADSTAYPKALELAEAAAIRARRVAAGLENVEPASGRPEKQVGLALSGGGIRSATFCLGVLQALAERGRLRDIDFLSTVSGGGYIGGFLGRLFTRLGGDVNDKVERVQKLLANTGSAEIWWLRKNADYIASAGHADVETNLAILLRNLFSVHIVVGGVLFALFGVLRWLSDFLAPKLALPTWQVGAINVSFWWCVPVALLLFVVVPLAVGYWLTPSAGKRYPILPLLLWIALLAGAVYGLALPGAALWSGLALGALLLAWPVQEVTRWRVASEDRKAAPVAPESVAADRAPDSVPNALVRNRVTRALGVALLGLAASLVWVALDSFAAAAATTPKSLWAMVGSAPVVVILRIAAVEWLKSSSGGAAAEQAYAWGRKAIVAGLAFLLALVLVFFIDVLVHFAFKDNPARGAWATMTALIASLVIGRWSGFLNLSSLQQAYGQKLIRTFLGATNDGRVHPSGDPTPVEIPSADDDVYFDEYHPERNGGPLHLINTCVNDTVASDSGRELPGDKGLPMCVGPSGVSVGRKYHALWQPREGLHMDETVVRPLPVAPDPNAFHVLGRRDNKETRVERLRLGQWMAISGAAVATGTGRFTTIPQALLLGLLNIRLGYWWDSGIPARKRPDRYPPNPWRRIKSLPGSAFRMQATLLNEWRGYFPGPAESLWYVTDGGHFDNTGLYELIRRRLPFIVAIDGGQDESYELDDLAMLTRQVRLDFVAEIEWLNSTQSGRDGRRDWATVPEWIRSFFEPNAVGSLTDLKRGSTHCSALARITYSDDRSRETWLLLVKANLAPPLPVDVRNYAAQHPSFPNESTANQFFKDDQWESYRALGQSAGRMVFRDLERTSTCGRTTPERAIEVKRLSLPDTVRVLFRVALPMFLLGLVTANRWPLWLLSRWGKGRRTMQLLRDLREKYGCDHFWLWFPTRRTLLVLAPDTIEAVLISDANAADPPLKKRAVSRFIPDALVISSEGGWLDRRPFNEKALGLEREHPHRDAFLQTALREVDQLAATRTGELRWNDFQRLGVRVSHQVIMGDGEVKPELDAQRASLVQCSNFLSRDTVAFPAFHGQIEDGLGPSASLKAHACLMAESRASLMGGTATGFTRVPSQIGFWHFVLKDAIELHVARTLALIAAHPEVQARVRDEVRGAGQLDASTVDGLRYLEACLHEQMRLWTPVPLLMRRAVRNFALRDEIPLAEEEQILIHAGFYHRDARVFGDLADRFSPHDALGSKFPKTYFFSDHRQRCAGRTLVTFLLKATLARLLRRHRYELVGPAIDPDSIPYLYDHFSVRLTVS
jgi:choline dehydrogenase-like flavoprotein/cytochrome P450